MTGYSILRFRFQRCLDYSGNLTTFALASWIRQRWNINVMLDFLTGYSWLKRAY